MKPPKKASTARRFFHIYRAYTHRRKSPENRLCAHRFFELAKCVCTLALAHARALHAGASPRHQKIDARKGDFLAVSPLIKSTKKTRKTTERHLLFSAVARCVRLAFAHRSGPVTERTSRENALKRTRNKCYADGSLIIALLLYHLYVRNDVKLRFTSFR